jgi:hypothetical protein
MYSFDSQAMPPPQFEISRTLAIPQQEVARAELQMNESCYLMRLDEYDQMMNYEPCYSISAYLGDLVMQNNSF